MYPSSVDPAALAEDLAPEAVRPLRRAEYEQMVERGVFEDERVELLHGVLVSMSPQHAPHAEVLVRLNELLVPAVAGRARVRVQLPLAVSEDSEPEPDLAVVAPGDQSRAHPASALLVIEVADTSLRKDRRAKGPVYAAAAVPEYWIVNLVERVIEVHRQPGSGRYQAVSRHGRGEQVALVAFPDVRLPVDAILP